MAAQLSQDEIDRLFRPATGEGSGDGSPRYVATPYDFRRPDRIPKEQLRAIHLMHDFLARNLASSLGAYLRAFVSVSLVSVEQLAFSEFLQYLPTPTLISSVSMPQLDGNAVLEINPSLVAPMLDIMLGGSGKLEEATARELTEIEQSIAEGVLKIVLQDLRLAWAPVAAIDFKVDAMETQPQLMQILSSNEAIVAIGFEITLGEARGMMNFGVPSILVKMVGQRFEQQWSLRRRSSSEDERRRLRALVEAAPVDLDARVVGKRIGVRDMMRLEVGDVLSLDVPVTRPVRLEVNGRTKFEAELAAVGRARALSVAGAAGEARARAGGLS